MMRPILFSGIYPVSGHESGKALQEKLQAVKPEYPVNLCAISELKPGLFNYRLKEAIRQFNRFFVELLGKKTKDDAADLYVVTTGSDRPDYKKFKKQNVSLELEDEYQTVAEQHILEDQKTVNTSPPSQTDQPLISKILSQLHLNAPNVVAYFSSDVMHNPNFDYSNKGENLTLTGKCQNQQIEPNHYMILRNDYQFIVYRVDKVDSGQSGNTTVYLTHCKTIPAREVAGEDSTGAS